ncbi:M1 family metallopeptidase [Actimicrobium antarcticum]
MSLALSALPVHATTLRAKSGAANSQITTQLPRSVRPTHYAVSITPDAKAATFAGHVTIDVQVLQPTASITLNAADLVFGQVQLHSANAGNKAAPANATVRIDADNETAIFTFGKTIKPGKYRLDMAYTGLIGSQAVGLFSLDYANADGPRRALYTQFENASARRMIPSWDEPNYKATFALQATVPAGQLAVSNMPIATTTTLADGRQQVTFGRSPTMSTYLLFFGLGDFERATLQAEGTELGVITQRGALPQAQFALDSSAAVLREYNNYFGVRYPLPKLDNIAAPGRSQFFGAMENWGAIFTFERVMLLDPTISTQTDKERAFSIAAHEIAHQWFGNLVTMQWWDDLWLNEGFASWMESRTTTRLHPEWQTALDAVAMRDDAMNLDAFITTHPVVQHVDTVEQASQAFDAITYKKGESVIGMLENYVGETAWRDGVRAYMKTHAYGNTTSDDLWRAVEKTAGVGKPIMAIAHDFTLQPGVPMIRVDDVQCKAGTSTITLSQSEFSRDQPGKAPRAWRVPVSVQLVGSSDRISTLVVGGKATLTVPGCGAVLVNAGQSGYYRTAYSAPVFNTLAAQFPVMAPIDQLGVMADSWALGVTGLQPMRDFLNLAAAAPLSAEPRVWKTIASAFQQINDYYKSDPARQKTFSTFAIARLTPMLTQLGWTARAGEADTVPSLREQLIDVLSELDDPVTIAEARRRFAAQDRDPTAVPAAIRKTIMAVVIEHADAPTWEAMRQLASAEKSPMIKGDLYQLLSTSKNPSLAAQAMALALTDEPGVTTSAGMLAGVSVKYPDLAFDFALANMARVNERVDASSLSRFFPSLASKSASPDMIVKVKAYADAHLAAGSRRDADTAVARIKDRMRIVAERLPEIDRWLADAAGGTRVN